MESLFKVEASLWPILNDNLEHAQTFWIPAIGIIDNYLKKLSIWKARKTNIWNRIAIRAVAATETDPAKRKSFFDEIRKSEGTSYRPLPGSNFPGSLPAPGQVEDKKEETNKVVKDIRDYFKKWWDTPEKRQEGGSMLPGRNYLVGEDGPEVVTGDGEDKVVGITPEIIRAKRLAQIEKSAKALERRSEQTTLGMTGVGIALKKLAPGPVGWALSAINADEDNEWRNWLRGKLGIEGDPDEPKPWHPGGAWDEKTALFGKGGQYALEGEGGSSTTQTSSTSASTEEFSALKYKDWRRSEEVEDYRTFEGTFGVPDVRLPGQQGSEGTFGAGGTFGPSYKHRRGGLPITQPPTMGDIGGGPLISVEEWEKTMRDRDKLKEQQEKEVGQKPGLNGELRFENVPDGVTVSTETEGFDNFTEHVNRAR
jgi:hypothetical protein